jgi:hypothetical protein
MGRADVSSSSASTQRWSGQSQLIVGCFAASLALLLYSLGAEHSSQQNVRIGCSITALRPPAATTLDERPAECVKFHNVTELADWQLWHCPSVGRFRILSNVTRYAVFTLRLVGPSLVFTSLSRRTESGIEHHLDYRTNAPGEHQAFIRFLVNGELDNITNCLSQMPPINYTFTVPQQHVSPSSVGLWEWTGPPVLVGNATNATSRSSAVHGQLVTGPRDAAALASNYAGLTFNFPFLPFDKTTACMSNRTTCLLGDSQMRHNYVHIVEALSGQVVNCNKHSSECFNPAARVHFFPLHYGHEWANLSANVTSLGCTHVAINFGQWPLSYVPPKPWPYHRYLEEIEFLFGNLSALSSNVYWVDTNPMPPMPYRCPPSDLRFPHKVVMLNDLVTLSMRMFPRLKRISSFDLVFQLWDSSYDGAHYKYPVGPVLARFIMTSLCSDYLP